MPPPYRILFLDADGTLFDYDAAEAAALEAAFLAVFGSYDADRFLPAYRAANKELWQELERGETTQAVLAVERFRRLARELGLPDVDRLATEISPRYLDELARGSRLLPGAEEVVRRLARTKILVLVTNGLSRVQRPRVERSPIASCFRALVISDEVGLAKPDPAIMELACRAIGVRPDSGAKSGMLMVGDSPRADIAAGAAFGIDTCWLNPRGAGLDSPDMRPTYQIADLGALLDIAG
jgi:YjjG family noncanonical pyrimidine nucleotidase